MPRLLATGADAGGAVAASALGPSWFFGLCMFVVSVWVVSFAIFLCGRSDDDEGRPRKKKPAPAPSKARPAATASRGTARSGTFDTTGMYVAAYAAGAPVGGCSGGHGGHHHGGGGGCGGGTFDTTGMYLAAYAADAAVGGCSGGHGGHHHGGGGGCGGGTFDTTGMYVAAYAAGAAVGGYSGAKGSILLDSNEERQLVSKINDELDNPMLKDIMVQSIQDCEVAAVVNEEIDNRDKVHREDSVEVNIKKAGNRERSSSRLVDGITEVDTSVICTKTLYYLSPLDLVKKDQGKDANNSGIDQDVYLPKRAVGTMEMIKRVSAIRQAEIAELKEKIDNLKEEIRVLEAAE